MENFSFCFSGKFCDELRSEVWQSGRKDQIPRSRTDDNPHFKIRREVYITELFMIMYYSSYIKISNISVFPLLQQVIAYPPL